MTEQNHQPGLLMQTVTFNRIQVATSVLSSVAFSLQCAMQELWKDWKMLEMNILSYLMFVDRALATTKDVSQGLT